ncbi:hypothetical protein CFI10_07460 [Marinobacterium iners]|uniref:HEPN domain-containing protein n=1 Tax=Marinobacterium iners TaxID=48076 RepID=UPI001A8D7721|nr:HEPN domain-containing protein [Marinobacterium iners]QSR34831.1 hypothetical protein CFI10_07460 [Marinobacterium iners]
MGGLKENYLHNQEERYARMADALGISWEELSELDYEIDANVSKDGLVYDYILQFSEENDPIILEKINDLDENRTAHLAPWVFERGSEDEHELEAILENIDPKASFINEIKNLEQLLAINLKQEDIKDILFRQIFISMMGALETYLSDTFINKVSGSVYFLENFVASHPEFKKQKFSLSDVFKERRGIEEKARSVMVETIYHKLPTVKKMYEDTFSISFPDISAMQKFVIQRHDLVHRNGKTTDGEKVPVSEKTITDLKNTAVDLVNRIEERMEDDDIPF